MKKPDIAELAQMWNRVSEMRHIAVCEKPRRKKW